MEALIAAGQITGGMAPKVRGAAEAVLAGVKQVHICGWNGPQTLSQENGAINHDGHCDCRIKSKINDIIIRRIKG